MAEQVQSGPQQSRARRFLGAGKRTLDGEDRSERIKTGRKGTLFRAFSPTIKPEFPLNVGILQHLLDSIRNPIDLLYQTHAIPREVSKFTYWLRGHETPAKQSVLQQI